jgi:hypothetical protein
MDSGGEFVAVDNPTATRFTLHILAAVAEHEAAMISARTKAALAAARVRGVKLGGRREGTRPDQTHGPRCQNGTWWCLVGGCGAASSPAGQPRRRVRWCSWRVIVRSAALLQRDRLREPPLIHFNDGAPAADYESAFPEVLPCPQEGSPSPRSGAGAECPRNASIPLRLWPWPPPLLWPRRPGHS